MGVTRRDAVWTSPRRRHRGGAAVLAAALATALALPAAAAGTVRAAASPVLTIRTGNGLVAPLEDIAGNGTDMWVLALNSGSVSEFSEATGALVRTTDGLSNPASVAVAGADLWISDFYDYAADEVSVASGTILGGVTLGLDPTDCICDMPGPIGSVADDGTDVWVDDYGFNDLAEIDAKSGALVRTVTMSSDRLTGEIAAADGNAWVTDDSGVAELSGTTGEVIDQIALPGARGLLAADGAIWVTSVASEGDGVGSSLTEIDETTGQILKVTPLGNVPIGGQAGMAANDADLFVAWASGVEEVSLATGELVAVDTGPRYGITSAQGVVASNTRVWVLDDAPDYLTELSATTGVPIRTAGPGLRSVADVAVVGAHLWTADDVQCLGTPSGGTLAEFSATSGTELRSVDAARTDVACPVQVIAAGANLWVLGWGNPDPDVLAEFNAATGEPRVNIGNYPTNDGMPPEMVLSAGHLFVLWSQWSLIEYSATTGAMLRAYNAGALGPNQWVQAIAADGANVWVAGSATLTELSGATGHLEHVYGGATHAFDQPTGGEPPQMVAGDGSVWIATEPKSDPASTGIAHYAESSGELLGFLQPSAVGLSDFSSLGPLTGGQLIVSGESTSPHGTPVLDLNASTGALIATLQPASSTGLLVQPLAATSNDLWVAEPGLLEELRLPG